MRASELTPGAVQISGVPQRHVYASWYCCSSSRCSLTRLSWSSVLLLLLSPSALRLALTLQRRLLPLLRLLWKLLLAAARHPPSVLLLLPALAAAAAALQRPHSKT